MVFVILAVFISLSLLVFFHEFGHFIFSKIFSVKVEEFGFGYPPRIFGLVKTDRRWKIFFGKNMPIDQKLKTIYSLNWIPFGGFNKLKEESGERKLEPDSFHAKSWWQKSLIALGGVFFNILLTIALLTVVFILGSYQVLPKEKSIAAREVAIQVIEVMDKSPAAQVGLKPADKILAVDNISIRDVPSFQSYIASKLGIPVKLVIQRGKQISEIAIAPIQAADIFKDTDLTGAAIGIGWVKIGKVSYSPPIALWQAIKKTGSLFYQIIATIIDIFRDLFAGKKMAVDVVGVVGLAAMTGKVAQMGIIYLLQFVAVISLLIAITQLVPFPAIDGGRIIFFIIEGIRRKPVNYKVENAINSVGFAALIILMIFITYRDIVKIASGFFKNLPL